MRLADLGPGADFRVSLVGADGEIRSRLVDLGFTEGAGGRVMRTASFKGPLHVRLRGYDLLLRHEEAASIQVEILDALPSRAVEAGELAPAPRLKPARRAGLRRFRRFFFPEDCCGRGGRR